MNFDALTKATVTDDPNPNTTPPTLLIKIPEYDNTQRDIPTAYVSVYIRVLATGVLVAGGKASLQLWRKDAGNSVWVATGDPILALPVNTLGKLSVDLADEGDAFIQIYNVVGLAATSVTLHYGF